MEREKGERQRQGEGWREIDTHTQRENSFCGVEVGSFLKRNSGRGGQGRRGLLISAFHVKGILLLCRYSVHVLLC